MPRSVPTPTALELPRLEAAWVERALQGDAAAFRALFERYAPSVRRFLQDLFRDASAADEGTQETFVRAHLRLDQLVDGGRVASWLFGIARNVYFEQRRAPVALSFEEDDDGAMARVDAVLPTPTPETLLLDAELEGLLKEALAEIPAPRRAALLLRIDHGLGYEEIAAVMEWSLPKVKNEIHRARLKLRVLLAQHLGERR